MTIDQIVALANQGAVFSPLSLSPVALYRGKGAASYAASKVNLANAGTNDLAEVVGAVPWAGASGWAFDATNVFDTGVVASSTNWTFIIQITNKTSGRLLFGARDGDNLKSIFIEPLTDATHVLCANCAHDTGSVIATDANSGNFAMAAQTFYLDGVSLSSGLPVGTAPTNSIYLGSLHGYGGGAVYTCQAFAMFNTTLTPTQVAQVAAWMAAL